MFGNFEGGGHRKFAQFEVMRVECAWVRGFEKFEGTIVALNVLGKCAWVGVGISFVVRRCGLGRCAGRCAGIGEEGARVWARITGADAARSNT